MVLYIVCILLTLKCSHLTCALNSTLLYPPTYLPWPKPNSQFPPQFVLPKCLTVSASVISIFLLFRPQILEPSLTPFLSHSPHIILQSLPSLSILKIFTNIYLPCICYCSGSCRYRREESRWEPCLQVLVTLIKIHDPAIFHLLHITNITTLDKATQMSLK